MALSVFIPMKYPIENTENYYLKNGFIREVTKGWYIPTDPAEKEGETKLCEKLSILRAMQPRIQQIRLFAWALLWCCSRH
jgi:hypothetical protein